MGSRAVGRVGDPRGWAGWAVRHVSAPVAMAAGSASVRVVRGFAELWKDRRPLKNRKIKAQNDCISALGLLIWHLPVEVLGYINNIEHK